MNATYLGRPCIHGHTHEDTELTLRYTSCKKCVECTRQNFKRYMKDPDKKAKNNQAAREYWQKIKADPHLYQRYKEKKSIEFKKKYHSDDAFRKKLKERNSRFKKQRIVASIKAKFMIPEKEAAFAYLGRKIEEIEN